LNSKYNGDTMVDMVKKLVKHGNSLALVIDKPVLELLKIQEDTPLEITTVDGQSLIIRPASEEDRKKRMRKAFDEVHKKFPKTLKNLANS